MNQLLHVSASPHIKDRVTTSSIMLDVIIALILYLELFNLK